MDKDVAPERPMTGRDKFWSEIGIDEKIERMRRMVKAVQQENNSLRKTIHDFQNHSHLEGRIVIPVGHGGYFEGAEMQIGGGPRNDEVYF